MTSQGSSSDISHSYTIYLNTYGNSHHNGHSLSIPINNSLENIDFTNSSLFPSMSLMQINLDATLQRSSQNQFMGQDFQQELNIQQTTSAWTSFNPTSICSDPISIHNDVWDAVNETDPDSENKRHMQGITNNVPPNNQADIYGTFLGNNTNRGIFLASRMNPLFDALETAINNVATHLEHEQSILNTRDGCLYLHNLQVIRMQTDQMRTTNIQQQQGMGFQNQYFQQNSFRPSALTKNQALYECSTCKRFYMWKYNLSRHVKYECGTESRFQCTHCKRAFPHKQNAILHCMRKHKIRHENNNNYVKKGDIIVKERK